MAKTNKVFKTTKVKPKETCRYTVLNLMTVDRAYYGGHLNTLMSDGYLDDIVKHHFEILNETSSFTMLS